MSEVLVKDHECLNVENLSSFFSYFDSKDPIAKKVSYN